MFYTHHSTGLGHLVRSLAVAGALAADLRVTVCSGGKVPDGLPVPPGIEIVALPSLATDAAGRLTAAEAVTVPETLQARAQLLLTCFERIKPDVLVIELFPFGRRKFAPELLPLLEQARSARPAPLVVCSVRDLLVSGHPDKQSHDDEAARRLDAYFDAVIVHGDPRFARLEESFRPGVPPRIPVYYSGFVASGPRPRRALRRRREVIVSAGGGRVGQPIFEAAAAAHLEHLGPLGFRTRLVTGPFLSEPEFDALVRSARRDAALTVERFVPDLRNVLATAAVSVSQCGYNTSLDLLLAGVPAVVVPYGDERENEQPERARRLAALGLVDVVPAHELDGHVLAERVVRMAAQAANRPALDVDGATQTATIIGGLLEPRLAVAQ